VASIQKTPSSTWKAVIRRRGWPTTVKTFRTKRDAKDWARRTEDEMVRGLYIDRAVSERMLICGALDRYLVEVSSTKSPSTARREKPAAGHLKKELGNYSLAALTPDIIAAYRDKRLNAGLSNSSVRLELALLSHLYTIAIKEWLVGLQGVAGRSGLQPGFQYSKAATTSWPQSTSRHWRREDAAQDLRRTLQSNAWMDRSYGSSHGNALRGNFVAAPHQIDLNKRTVTLTETKNGSIRTVPLSHSAAVVLRAALSNPVRPFNTDLVFFGEPGRDGKRRPYDFKLEWHRKLQSAGIKGLRFHDLRHEAVSRLVEAGLSDQEVAAISGHKSMQMLRRYTHLRAEDLVHRLDQLGVR